MKYTENQPFTNNNKYILQHKNIPVAEIEFDTYTGKVNSIGKIYNSAFLPVSCQNDPAFLKAWWKQRATSKHQGNIEALLSKNGIESTHSFLLDNLGLSVTDSYWVKPENTHIDWEQVSFHLNSFDEDVIDFISKKKTSSSSIIARFTPSASTGGELKKKWIKRNGQLYLIKGNMTGYSFQQSLNEVFASKIHEAQEYDNYVPYKLIKFNDDSHGCISSCFTSEDTEFIPAWEYFQKNGNTTSDSYIQQFVDIAAKEGFDGQQIQTFMNYQTISDFLITNIDRHTNNFGLLRDSNTLEPIGPAPIFDSGNSMFYLGIGIADYRDLFEWPVSSLHKNEREMMKRISNYSSLDISKLPTQEEVGIFYSKDPTIAPYSKTIAGYYEFKRNIIKCLQNGSNYDQVEKDVSAYFGDVLERKEINKCWNSIDSKKPSKIKRKEPYRGR